MKAIRCRTSSYYCSRIAQMVNFLSSSVTCIFLNVKLNENGDFSDCRLSSWKTLLTVLVLSNGTVLVS